MKRLVLIDGNAILHRAYHALPPLTNRAGELVNAVYGFSTMLLKVINDLKPDFLAVAFDTEKPTFRKMEYLGYQAKRPEMDQELSGQIEKIQEVVHSFGIPIYTAPGFEADDVIGTLATQAVQGEKVKRREGKKKSLALSSSRHFSLIDEVIIVTGDRDMMQLVGPKIKVYAPVRGMSETEMFNEKKVEERLGVPPKQIVDLKGLTGDTSDNYPGVPGVGPKTAVELLKKYKDISGVYQHLSSLPETLARKLAEGKELAELSQKLARIVIDVPIELDLEKCRFDLTGEGKERAAEKFRNLGFKSLVARMRPEEKPENLPALLPDGTGPAGRQDEKTKKQKDSQQELF